MNNPCKKSSTIPLDFETKIFMDSENLSINSLLKADSQSAHKRLTNLEKMNSKYAPEILCVLDAKSSR